MASGRWEVDRSGKKREREFRQDAEEKKKIEVGKGKEKDIFKKSRITIKSLEKRENGNRKK